MLEHDEHGFLKGNPIDLGQMPKYLLDIKSDVAAIKRAIIGSTAEPDKQPSVNPPVGKSNTAINVPVQSRASEHQKTVIERLETSNTLPTLDTRGSFVSGINAPSAVESAVKPIAPPTVEAPPIIHNPPSIVERLSKAPAKSAVVPNRDTSGRFIGNGNDESGNESPRDTDGAVTALANRLSALSGIGSGLEEADPTVKAFQEIAEPMKRGFEFFGGGKDDKQTKWLRNIFGMLKLSRKEETVYQKATQKTLKAIEGKPVGGGGDGGSSGIMLMLSGLLGRLGPMLLKGVTAVLGFIFSPIGLAIGAASAVAWGLFTESGQKFFGEVGAKIIAGWDTVVTAFAPITESISKGWDTVKGGFDSLISGMVSSWDAFTGFLKDKFGIDIPAIFKPVVDVSKKAVEAATETVQKGTEVAKDTAGKAVDAVQKSSPKTTQALSNLWGNAKEGAENISRRAKFNEVEAAKNFQGGEQITGLSDVQTRALAANTSKTESAGKVDADNKQGYFGQYQFGAEALVESGLVKQDKLAEAKKASGDNWYKKRNSKGEMGGHEAFLRDKSNWNTEGGLDAFLQDKAQQDNAFVKYTNKNVAGGIRSGAISKDDSAENIAGYSKAAHLKGVGGANKLFKDGIESFDGNNTSTAVYAKQGAKAMTETVDAINAEAGGKTPSATASISDDPTQGGRYKYETLEGGKVQVTDNETATIGLASDEQANAYRKQQGKPYLDKVAAINSDDMSMYNRLAAGPRNTAAMVSAPVPSAPVMPTSPKIA
ncbi:MAG: hypothetical protein ACXWT0_00465, partial [Methylobacter sp.]